MAGRSFSAIQASNTGQQSYQASTPNPAGQWDDWT